MDEQETQRLMAMETASREPDPRIIARLNDLEAKAVDLAKRMAADLGSRDANDSGPAICAIWNLGAEARRLALIIVRATKHLGQA